MKCNITRILTDLRFLLPNADIWKLFCRYWTVLNNDALLKFLLTNQILFSPFKNRHITFVNLVSHKTKQCYYFWFTTWISTEKECTYFESACTNIVTDRVTKYVFLNLKIVTRVYSKLKHTLDFFRRLFL